MSKRYFVQISTDPDVDPRKCAVALAGAGQAITDGHSLNIFFASHSVKHLKNEFYERFTANIVAVKSSWEPFFIFT